MTDRCGHISFIQSISGRALAVTVPFLLFSGAAAAEAQFEKALIYLERNVTDDDIEVRIIAMADDTGFAALRVIAPDGRIVIDFKAPDSKLGIRHLDLESPEPRDKASVRADFPEGTYRFEGTLVDGVTLRAEATLKHGLPEAPTLSSPRSGQTELPVKGAKVRWEPVADASSWEVVLKEENGARELRTRLPGSSAAFAIPDGFLVPGEKYEISVGSIQEGGNRSYQETEFTAQKR
jgi:hypothetical protein